MFYNNNGRWRHSKKVDSNDLLLRFIALLVVSSSLETFQFDLVAVSFQSMYPQKKTKRSYISRCRGSNLRPSSSKLVYDMKRTLTPKTTVPWHCSKFVDCCSFRAHSDSCWKFVFGSNKIVRAEKNLNASDFSRLDSNIDSESSNNTYLNIIKILFLL